MERVCKKCGCLELELRQSGPNTGLYCTECNGWQGWIPKAEIYLYTPTPEVKEPEPCAYCDADYVIPTAYEGGISNWESIDAKFCPMCGRGRGHA